MTRTDENWGFLVASVIKSECPKCDRKYQKFGRCTRTCAIELKLVQPGTKCLRDYWRGDDERTDD